MDREQEVYLSLVVPAYNEGKRIAGAIETIDAYLQGLGKPCEIIAVDDGSSDSTHEILREEALTCSSLRIVSYEKNRGKGYAVRQGVYASRGQFVAFSDADLSTPIDELGKLFAAVEKGYDIAIGSRAAKGAELGTHQPWYRELGGKGLNLIIQALAVPGIWDTQCGFKLLRGDVAREIFESTFIDGWGFDIEVLYLARKLGYKIAEVGVCWNHAEGSKIRPFRAGLTVLQDILRMRMHNYDIR